MKSEEGRGGRVMRRELRREEAWEREEVGEGCC